MKRKVIGFIVCMLLIGFSALSATGTMIGHRDIKQHSNDYDDFKKQTNSKSENLDYWTEQDKLISTVGESGDYFGCSVSIDGSYAIIGAYGDDGGTGSAYIFNRSGETWSLEQKLIASDGEAGDYFGYSVSIYGDLAIIGAYADESYTGAVYAFNISGSTWNEQIKLEALDGATGDRFGCSVFLDEKFVIIGAYGDDSYSGSAYILEYCCYWKWREKVNISGGLPFFGWSVSIDGDYAIIGAPGIPDSGSTGSAYIFKRDGNRWYEHDYWNGTNYGEYLGMSVSIDGGYAIVGAYGDDGGAGSAYIFNRNGTTWTNEQKLTASDSAAGDSFGSSVSMNAGYAIIGAANDDDNIGSAYVFMKSGIPDLSIDISGGLGVKVIITNNGDNDTQNLDVEIYVRGGIFKLINKSVVYTIDLLAGESKPLSAGLFLGLGEVFVTATTDYKEKTIYGMQMLIFTYIK